MKEELVVNIGELTGEFAPLLVDEARTLSGYRFHVVDGSVVQTIVLGGMSLLFR